MTLFNSCHKGLFDWGGESSCGAKKLFWGVSKSLLNINETCFLESFFSRSSHNFFVCRIIEVDGTFEHDGFSRLFAGH